jgi:cell division protein FtsB
LATFYSMSSLEDTASLNREELLALVAELELQIMALQEQVAQLAASNQALVAENEQLRRSGKR